MPKDSPMTCFCILPGTSQPHDAIAFFFTKPHAVNSKVDALVVSPPLIFCCLLLSFLLVCLQKEYKTTA